MSSKPIIAVIGSTGLQGGSVARYLLNDKTFAVRAITRNVNSPKAQELKNIGAEIVAADLDNVESLKKAFHGAYGVFGVTVWGLFALHNNDQKKTLAHEEQHGRNLVDAAEAEGIKHLVWSTLSHVPGDQVYIYHFEPTNVEICTVDEYLKTKNVGRTSLYTSWCYQDLTIYGVRTAGYRLFYMNSFNTGDITPAKQLLTKIGDEFVAIYPGTNLTKVPTCDVHETGAWVLVASKNPEEWIGKDLHAVGDLISGYDAVETLSKVTGKKVRREDITEEVFESRGLRDKVGDELWLNLWPRDQDLSHKAHPTASTFVDYAKNDTELKEFLGL